MDFHVEGVLYYNSAKFLLLLTNSNQQLNCCDL